ncbi:hypothetical protein SEA_WALTZ_46 [Arthrobacter phage Waltz]|nr:hypothetical protein SEA_WALTZ_46 [Arthrobacter phage Waltz]
MTTLPPDELPEELPTRWQPAADLPADHPLRCICSYNSHRPAGQGTRTDVSRNRHCPVHGERPSDSPSARVMTDAERAWEDVETMGPLTEADRLDPEHPQFWTPEDGAKLAAERMARVVEVDGDLLTVELQPGMAAHMARHNPGGYSIQGGALSSDSRPEVWPL